MKDIHKSKIKSASKLESNHKSIFVRELKIEKVSVTKLTLVNEI